MNNIPFRCPVCKNSLKLKDKSERSGAEIVRTAEYKCGTVMKLIQDQFKFREKILASTKCTEQELLRKNA